MTVVNTLKKKKKKAILEPIFIAGIVGEFKYS